MTSLHFVVHPLPGNEEQLNERLKAISDKLNRFGSTGSSALNNLRVPVKVIVVGPTHFALLLEDGRICRVNFSIITDRLDLTKNESTKKTNIGSGGGARQLTRNRARIMRSSTLRGSRAAPGNSIQIGRPIVPAPYVPEELVAHAQVVLQGKSRNLIIRELQRTNLDVNLAVNNLLSRDEEEADDTEDAQDSYVPEDLISLLDGGFHDQHSVIIDADTMFSEDMFGYSAIRSRGGSSTRRQTSTLDREREPEESSRRQAERDSFNRWRDRQYFGPRKWLESALRDPAWDKDADSKKKEMAQQSPLWTSDELEFWPDNNVRFTMMAGLHSELVAVSTNGQLYQWRWCDPEPYKHPENPFIHHPKTVAMGLLTEKVTMISGTIIRASAVTESNRVCTWVDESLAPIASKLEHSLQTFSEFGTDRIVSIHTCALYTLVRMDTGALYWWGVLPFAQRRKLWEKFRAKSRKHRPTSSSQDIVVGSQVCMKNSPMCQPGALGFTIACGVPKIGQLQNAAWNLTDSCRFKLLPTVSEPTKSSLSQMGIATTLSSGASVSNKPISNKETADSLNMPPPPSPASSTCSDTGSTSHKRAKRPASKNTEPEERKDEEEWLIKNVIFLEDVKSVPVGRVLKVDGAYAAVKFPTVKETPTKESSVGKGANTGFDDDSLSLLQDCRLMRVEDLQVLKSNATSRGAPDCFQRVPKRVTVPDNQGHVIALAVDTQGIHAIVRNNSKMSYVIYNLSSGRVEQESVFPTDCIPSFTGSHPNNINLTCTGEGNEGVVIVRDSNSTIFPLAKDCLDSIRDPQWLDLPPIKCLGAGTHALSGLSNKNMKNQVAVIVMALESQMLMSKILRCDLEGIKSVLTQLENDAKSTLTGVHPNVASVLAERCDGNRNIFHACVTMCVPTGNKEPDERDVLTTSTTSSGGLEPINVFRNAFNFHRDVTNRSHNLREMMQRATAAVRGTVPPAPSATHSTSTAPPAAAANPPSAVTTTRASVTSAQDGVLSAVATEGEAPPPPPPPSSSSANDESIPTLNWPPDPLNHSGDEDSFMDLASAGAKQNNASTTGGAGCSKYILDPAERKGNALAALRLLCESPVLEPHLLELLSAKDAQGLTPFMMGVTLRAYPAAVVLLETIQVVAGNQYELDVKSAMNAMIYPPGSNPDNNPLHVLCCNDTCSFTWTGAEHINQDIFECRTCGLTGSLCCCTECARVCHKGHDCKLKKTSPTAYCDCWEKCKCKALIMGAQVARFQLLCHLVLITDLVIYPNTRGENILLFLVQTVGRQSVEQRQYRSSRPRSTSNTSSSRKTPSSDIELDMPEHDLEPPRFTRRALERLLNDWQAVRAMIMSGVKATPTLGGGFAYLQSQSGTTLLDKFTHCLLVKCSIEMLDTLITTLIRELQNESEPGRVLDARTVARRFIRSVARIFVIFSIETIPTSNKKRGLSSHSQHILKCRRAFQALIKLAIEELCEIADSLIAPVRLGVVRPTAPFALASNSLDVINGSEELFAVEPMAYSGDLHGDGLIGGIATLHNLQTSTPAQPPNSNLEMDEVDATEAMVVDDDTSEQEDNTERSQDRGEAMENEQHELAGNQIEDGDQRDDQSDTTELDLLAESESESDDNHDPASGQSRSEQIATAVGSDTDEDSGESSQQEEEESEAGETDEQETNEELPLQEEQLERRAGGGALGAARSNFAPHSMQWAIRSREPRVSGAVSGGSGGGAGAGSAVGVSATLPSGSTGPTRNGASGGVRLTGTNSLVFIDPTSLRRSTSTVVSAQAQASEPVTMATTASVLARAFAIVVRQIADLLTMLQDYHTLGPILPRTLDVSSQESLNIQLYLEYHLKPTWDWLLTVMDSTEAQLRFGASLTHSTEPTQSGVSNRSNAPVTNSIRPVIAPTNPLQVPRMVGFNAMSSIPSTDPPRSRDRDSSGSARRELLSYCLSLMRAHNAEHLDSLPVLDVSALKHIAYVLDALIYYMRSGFSQDSDISSKTLNIVDAWTVDQDENENDENEDEISRAVCGMSDSYDDDGMSTRGRKHPFLQRSDSTLCLGCPPPDPFESPLIEALPLADQPQLLQPNARREDLFGMPKQPITVPPAGTNAPGTYNPLETLPTRLGLSMRTADTTTSTGAPVMNAVPSTHLTPCAFNFDKSTPSRVVVSGGAAGGASTSSAANGAPPEGSGPGHGPPPVAGSSAQPISKTTFLEMYNDLMQEMEEPLGVVEEPQDLSLHQLTQETEKMDVDFSDEYSDSDNEASRSSVAGSAKTQDPVKEEEDLKSRECDGAFKQTESTPDIESVEETDEASREKKSSSPTLAAQSLLNLARRFPRTPPHRPASPTPDRAPIIVTSKNVANAIALALEANKSSNTEHQPVNKEGLKLCDLRLAALIPPSVGESSSSGVKSVIVRAGSSSQNMLSSDAPDVLVVPRNADEHTDNSNEIADVSTQVTVETTPANNVYKPQPSIGQSVSHDLLLGRWRLSLDLFGRVFMEDVGLEPGSVVAELGGFPVKEAKFRREMERIRNAQQRDLNLSKMERDRTQLILATFKELNTLYCNSHRRNNIQGGLAVNRVKVTFKDEPGEGSGVARSFYTAIAEALLANEKLPNLDAAQVPTDRIRGESSAPRSSPRSSSSASIRVLSDPRSRNRGLSVDARVYVPPTTGNEPTQPRRNEHLTQSQKQMGDKLYPKVYAQRPAYAGKITGMLLELSSAQVLMLMASEETLKHKVEQAYEMILNIGDDGCSNAHLDMDGFSGDKKTGPGAECDNMDVPEDNSPLFYSPGKRGFHSPRQGRSTYQRLNAFRNVGRLLGLCLLQNELCPIFLNRHVLKYILGRMIRFHDLAFFDPVIYESLRELVLDAERKDGAQILQTLDLTFSIDLSVEEGGGSVELVQGGREIPVTVHNVYDYVRKYAQARMIKTQEKALLAMRTGVFDVLPTGALDGLTAEDLRLLLNGVGDINVQVLISYTSFNDESGESSDRLVKFKRWLWSIVDKMTHLERQDLVYFWTGSPALPASEDGFQPMPSVTIRPADDAHLPTANTCISRLYIPLYSCRQVLRHKLLIAIKTKNFGFV